MQILNPERRPCTRYYTSCPVVCEIHHGLASIVSDLHQGLCVNVYSGHGRHTYMTRMYADKNFHIPFVLVAGHGVKPFYLRQNQIIIYPPCLNPSVLRVKFQDIAPPPSPLHNNSAGSSWYLRYIAYNALQISQNGGNLISSTGRLLLLTNLFITSPSFMIDTSPFCRVVLLQ